MIQGPDVRSEAATRQWPAPKGSSTTILWAVTVVATGLSTCALDLVATGAGALLATSNLLDGTSRVALVGFLAVTYLLWAAGLRANVVANWCLLEQTGTSTNLVSKVMFELARRRTSSRRAARAASAAGYVGTEIAKEVPYYAGAFGTALFSDAVTSTDAIVFIAGTNIGAAVWEYGVARLSRTVLKRRSAGIARPRRNASDEGGTTRQPLRSGGAPGVAEEAVDRQLEHLRPRLVSVRRRDEVAADEQRVGQHAAGLDIVLIPAELREQRAETSHASVYMAFIKPFRYLVVHPALMRQVVRAWGRVRPGEQWDGQARTRARA